MSTHCACPHGMVALGKHRIDCPETPPFADRCSGCGVAVDEKHADDCPVWAEQRDPRERQASDVYTARTCLVQNFGELPQSGIAHEAADVFLVMDDDLNDLDNMTEVEFLDAMSSLLIEYKKIADTNHTTAAEMASELTDWRAFATGFRKLLVSPLPGER